MDVQELIDREAIRALVVAYNSFADRGRFDETLALFEPSARMATPFGEYDGREAIRSVFTAAQDQASTPAPRPGRPHVRHHLSTHHIEVIGPGHATGRCYFAVVTQVGLDHWGHYLDEYVERGEGWRFASRQVRVDGQHPDSLFPRSLGGAGSAEP